MSNGLFDPVIVSFMFAPLAVTGAVLFALWWRQIRHAMMIVVKIFVLLTLGCLVAGVPLGLAGWLRRKRMRWLSAMGVTLSICIFAYFLTVMHFLSGGD